MQFSTYRLNYDDFLEVHKGQSRVSDEVGALTAVKVSLLKLDVGTYVEKIFVEVHGNAKVSNSLAKHA